MICFHPEQWFITCVCEWTWRFFI